VTGVQVSPKEFTSRLVALYNASGLSGRELARQAAVSNSTVNGWLHGTLPKDANELRRAVEACFTAVRRRRPAVRLTPWDTAERWVVALALAVQCRDAAPPAPRVFAEHRRPLYIEQVKRIAPPRLIGREAELAELAAFCLREDGDAYAWWQAGPWAGKSALLATFVLSAERLLPAPVRLISYFVTARLADQDTRESFTTSVIDQLCALNGQDAPTATDVATREAMMSRLLGRAAAACRAGGGRLVLVVDGLDEERGTDFGPYTHSIAGLLPAAPPDGMRILIASRLSPPVPNDVLAGHPLRDAGVIRPLTRSEHAQDLRLLAQRELRRLLTGSTVEQDVLGLITVARSGLTAVDLRALTGATLVEIDDVVHTAAGRTFLYDDEAAGYAFGHEELHRAAMLYISHDRLATYRDRLDAWADRYRRPADPQQRPWPADTPPYLLWKYAAAVAERRDTDRLVALACDAARHDRMLDESGADHAGLAEIRSCQDLLLQEPEPDLYAMSLLSYHRHRLERRTTTIPADLPAVWASLGQGLRAEALARSIADDFRRAEALTALARAVAGHGDYDHAVRTARLIGDTDRQARALTEVVDTAARTGGQDWVSRYADGLTDPERRAHALEELAWSAARAGDHVRVVQLARTIDDRQKHQLVELVRTMAEDGGTEHALTLAADIERALRGPTADQRQWILCNLADAVAAAGDHDGAERIAGDITDPEQRARAWDALVHRMVEAGAYDRAEQVSSTIVGGYRRSCALSEIAKAVAQTGDSARAVRIARRITDPNHLSNVLAELVGPIAEAGNSDEAVRIAYTIPHDEYRVAALTTLVRVMAKADEYDRAEEIARSIGDYGIGRSWALSALMRAMADAGFHDRAQLLALAIDEPSVRMSALTNLAIAVADTGDEERARALAVEARRVDAVRRPAGQRTLSVLARLAVRLGDPELARTWVAETAQAANPDSPSFNAKLVGTLLGILADLVHDAARSGNRERVTLLADDAERVVRRMDTRRRRSALRPVAQAVAEVGELRWAEQIIRRIGDPTEQTDVLSSIAQSKANVRDYGAAAEIAAGVADPQEHACVLAKLAQIAVRNDDRESARELAVAAEQAARADVAPTQWAQALAVLATAAAEAGDHTLAEQIARGITVHYQQAMALTSVARAVAASGDQVHATRIAMSITDRYARTQALTDLPTGPRNDHNRIGASGRELGVALATEPWWAPLPVLAVERPDVVLRLAAVHAERLSHLGPEV
jgi:transcriptional regulator with XRE-family HTH domain